MFTCDICKCEYGEEDVGQSTATDVICLYCLGAATNRTSMRLGDVEGDEDEPADPDATPLDPPDVLFEQGEG